MLAKRLRHPQDSAPELRALINSWHAWPEQPMIMKRPSNLQLALGLSLSLHGLLLGLKIADPERFDKLFTDTPLEVILVNSASQDKPRQAQAIAQHNLAGGGASEKGRAASPTAASALTQAGDSPEEARRRSPDCRRSRRSC